MTGGGGAGGGASPLARSRAGVGLGGFFDTTGGGPGGGVCSAFTSFFSATGSLVSSVVIID